jgi:hypothetical protein
LFRVFDRKYLHEEVGGIATARHIELESTEVLHRLASIALENSESISHEDQAVKVEKGF